MKGFTNKWTALFLSNFFGVFNDNLLKCSIIFIAVGWTLPDWLTRSQLISVVSASLVVPYLFLSPLGGRLAVVYSKKKVFRICKFLEIPTLAVACVAFYFQWALLAVLSVLIMGILSCLYSPSKYSLIRDIGGEDGVSFGSGFFETMAFLGILVGTVVASVISDVYNFWVLVLLFIGLAVFGYLITSTIRAKELPVEGEDTGNIVPVHFLINSWKYARKHKFVNSAVLGASTFWLIGNMLQMNLIIHCKNVFHTSNSTTGMIMACAAIGIASGCSTAGRISGRKVKSGLILLGLTGMIVMLFILTFFRLHFWFFAFCVFITAFSGGLFQVPSLSMLQNSDLGRKLGDMIAYLNLVTFILILLGTLIFSVTTYFSRENSYVVFGVILSICLLVTAYFLLKSPEFRNETLTLFKRQR